MGRTCKIEERGLDRLKVWHRARELMVAVHKRVVPQLPPEEKWDLAKQIRRSSKSVAANIAESHGRYYYQQGVFFCYIARGSLDETINHLVTALELEYIRPLPRSTSHRRRDPSHAQRLHRLSQAMQARRDRAWQPTCCL